LLSRLPYRYLWRSTVLRHWRSLEDRGHHSRK
jgi:hypothetical protein